MPEWSVYVKTPTQFARGDWAALEALVDAVEADERTSGASVAREDDGASVYMTVDAASAADARIVSETIVEGALARVGRDGEIEALQVYDADGNAVA